MSVVLTDEMKALLTELSALRVARYEHNARAASINLDDEEAKVTAARRKLDQATDEWKLAREAYKAACKMKRYRPPGLREHEIKRQLQQLEADAREAERQKGSLEA